MKELYDLKELYLDEIKKINKKGELTPTINETVKCILEVMALIDEICCNSEADGGYSERFYSDKRRNHMPEMYERRGRSASTGRYISRHGDPTADRMIRKLEDLRSEARDSETLMAIECAIKKLEDY